MSDDPRRNANLEKRVGLAPGTEEFPMAEATAWGLIPPHVGMGFCASANEADRRASDTILELGPEKRQREFRLGRQCGERALRNVGWRPPDLGSWEDANPAVVDATDVAGVIGVGSDSCPQWPTGYVGSISHSRRWVWAVAAAQRHYRGIGVDTEPIVSAELRDMLQFEIGTDQEWQLMESLGLPVPLQFTLLFSAKEAYFKLWYPLTRRFLNFDDVRLHGVLEKPAGERSGAMKATVVPRIALIMQSKQNGLEAEHRSSDLTRCEVVASWSTQDVMTLTWLTNKLQD